MLARRRQKWREGRIELEACVKYFSTRRTISIVECDYLDKKSIGR